MNIHPRKFHYFESHYFGNQFEISQEGSSLQLLSSTGCIPALDGSEEYTTPSANQWLTFQKALAALKAHEWPTESDENIMNGFGVEIWVTFRRRIKLYLHNPDFTEFYLFRDLVNDLTKCKPYPLGLLYSDPMSED
jgi:hypothetical protein